MRSADFVRAVKRVGRVRGVAVTLDTKRGKGSHALLKFGARQTIVKDRRKTIGRGLLRKMCRDLGITPGDLE